MLLRLLEGEEGPVKTEDQQPSNNGDQQQTGETNEVDGQANTEVKNDNPVAGETTDNTNSKEADSLVDKKVDPTDESTDGQQNSENAPKDNVESKDG